MASLHPISQSFLAVTCGSGHNLVILASATFVSHCGTTARAAEVMSSICGGGGGSGSTTTSVWNSKECNASGETR
ncbi:hypothetical protein Tco_0031854 [Tanacetum coccineum]